MAEKFNYTGEPVTPYQRELLELIAEECAEVVQRATKIMRFGPTEVQPGQELSNVARISREVGDLLEVLERAEAAGLIDRAHVATGRMTKRAKLLRYLKNEAPRG